MTIFHGVLYVYQRVSLLSAFCLGSFHILLHHMTRLTKWRMLRLSSARVASPDLISQRENAATSSAAKWMCFCLTHCSNVLVVFLNVHNVSVYIYMIFMMYDLHIYIYIYTMYYIHNSTYIAYNYIQNILSRKQHSTTRRYPEHGKIATKVRVLSVFWKEGHHGGRSVTQKSTMAL